MILENVKKALFYFITLLPLLVLIGIAANVTLNAARISAGIAYPEMHSEIKKYLSSDRSKLSVKRTSDELVLSLEYIFPDGETESFNRLVDINAEEEGYNVFVVGSSPVIARPPWEKGSFKVFSDILEDKLISLGSKRPIRVYNLGMTSADSLVIKKITEAAVSELEPDLIIYYYGGGMDYETAYYAAKLKQQHYPLTVISARKNSASGLWGFVRKYGGWINRMYLQPYLISFLQRIGAVRLDPEDFEDINSTIYKDIEKNILALSLLAKNKNIPIIFVTALNNFEARPFGIDRITRVNYEAGMREADVSARYAYLVTARDSEIFTGDIGAKSAVNDIFRRFAGSEGSYVIDLHNYLVAKGETLGYNYFYDYAHMKPALQEIIADKIFECIGEKRLFPGYIVDVIGKPIEDQARGERL